MGSMGHNTILAVILWCYSCDFYFISLLGSVHLCQCDGLSLVESGLQTSCRLCNVGFC